jgi:hypothetical protein
MALGPNQLVKELEKISKTIAIDKWKNIPEPLCQATSSLLSMLGYIKKFIIYQETRLNNQILSTT